MKQMFLSIAFLCFFSSLFAQEEEVVLINVRLDSLKKVIERTSDFQFFYVEKIDDEPVKISVSWNRANLLGSVKSALNRVGYSISQFDNILYAIKGIEIVTRFPERFFAETVEQTRDSSLYATNLSLSESREAESTNKIYVVGDPKAPIAGTRATISGYIRDIDSKEPVAYASISVVSSGVNVSTDIHGYYRIAVPLGRTDLDISGYGFEQTQLMLDVFANGTLDILVKEKVYSLQGAVVSAETNQQRRTTYVGLEKLQISRVKHIPTVFGEADVIKVILTLPGVKAVGESSGGFNVRGGASDQNLILFNEGTIYNPSHLFGLFSTFNPDVVSDIELYKSTIPARYGGRISSVLEVNSRQGNSTKITGSLGIGLLTGKLHIEGPIIKDRTNFIAGARTSYSNWMLKLLPKSSGYREGTADFHDITAGLSHIVNDANTFYLYAYYSGDQFSFSRDTTYSYGSLNLAFKWRSIFSHKHSMTFAAGYDQYNHNIEETADPVIAYNMGFGLKQYFVKANFDLLVNERHALSYGLNGVYFNLSPGTFTPSGSSSLVIPDYVDREQGIELALYVSDKWDLSDLLSIDMGIRYVFYSALGPCQYFRYLEGERDEESIMGSVQVNKWDFVKPYHGPEFRLSARYFLNDETTLKAGFNTMRQNIHMLSNTVSASPIDIWKLTDANIAPQTGWQIAAGIYRNFFKSRYELSIEGYYKSISHYLDYKSGAVLNMNKHIEQDVVETEGKAYGVEIMIKKPLGKLNGWLAYSYSKTLLRESGEKEIFMINKGNWYPASYDKPHDLKVIMNYKFTQRYSISANLDYSSGRPVTIPIGVYHYSDGYWLAYSNRNQYRIPDYFRLDAAFNIEPSHNLRLWTHSVITFGVYNLTGRKNAFSVFYTKNERDRVQGYKLSIFGAPIPYINYTLKF